MANGSLLLLLPAIIAAAANTGSEIPYDVERSANATYYLEADGTGNCMFDALPEPQYVGALNQNDYFSPVINNNSFPAATLCGAYAHVTGRKGSVTIKIVDRCPGCPSGHIDLSPEAFAAIDSPALGFVPIRWQLVSAPVQGPLRFRYKEGSSQWWTAIQVRNHRNPVARLDYLNDSGWQRLSRTSYNYFIAPGGLGEGKHTFRITDVFGNSRIEKSTYYLDQYTAYATDWSGLGQFPPPAP